MLWQRVLTALIGLPLLITLLAFAPAMVVYTFLLICLFLAIFEAASMLLPRLDQLSLQFKSTDTLDPEAVARHDAWMRLTPLQVRQRYASLAIFCAVIGALIFSASHFISGPSSSGLITFGLTITILTAVFATRGIDKEMSRVVGFVLSIVYAGLPWITIWELYKMAPMARNVFLLLTIIWCGDTGAYFGGRFFGKHKLSPFKSPKKTWEGAVAGLLTSVLGAHILNHFFFADAFGSYGGLVMDGMGGVISFTLIAVVTGIVGQLGDLIESVFKRFAQVKDSGAIFPGHGGILDRTDAVLTGAPVLWFLLHFW